MKQFSFIIRKLYSIIAVVVLCLGFSSCSIMGDVMQGMAQGVASYPMYGYGMSYNTGYMGYVAPTTVPSYSYTASGTSASSGSSSYSSSSYSSSSSSSSSGKMCGLCVGSGDCKTCNGKGYYYSSFDLSKTIACPNCRNHNGKCSSCGGTGYR